MSLLNAAENLMFYTKEKKRKYIYSIFNDYEEYINREKLSLKEDLSQDKKLMIIVNIAVAYYNTGNYKKAIKMMKILDDYELNDEMTFIYYVNLVEFNICNNDEQAVDYLYDEAQSIIKKYDTKYPEIIDIYNIMYSNFKGRYEESLEILKRNRIKNKDTDNYNLLIADIAFNTDKIDEGIFIISEMCKTYYKKEICIQKQIDILINTYMNNLSIEKCGSDTKMSFEREIWGKVKDSKIKTSILFAYIDLKKLFKKNWFLCVALPFLVALFLSKVFIPLFFGETFSKVPISIISFLFLVYMLFGFGYFAMKYTKGCKNGLIPAVVVTFIVVNLLMGFFLLDFTNNVLDLKYAITKTDISDSGIIQSLKIRQGKKLSTMEIKINNKVFIIDENEKLYDYINSNFKEGNRVNIEYLPHSMLLVNIQKQ